MYELVAISLGETNMDNMNLVSESDVEEVVQETEESLIYAYINFGPRFRNYTEMLFWAIEWGGGHIIDFQKQSTGTLFRVSYLRSEDLRFNAAIAPFMPEFWQS